MTQSDDWRREATAEQMRSVVRTIDPSVAHIARIWTTTVSSRVVHTGAARHF
jgi:hypothetical protein